MKRAIRRSHYQRLKLKRGKRDWGYQYDRRWDEARAGLLANTSRPCSCWMCGNVRRYFGVSTYKEQLAKLNYIEGCEEANIRCNITRNQIRYTSWW